MVTSSPSDPRRWNAGPVDVNTLAAPAGLRRTRKAGDRIGDVVLYGLTALASLIGVLFVAAIV
ncbi:MAG: hypothetical protein QOD85_1170, partial [Gaiellaceae bacterium]|nr:hypothetical protein [Gaiellaceae bacterium]